MSGIKPLSSELQKVAIEELGEVPARVPEDLQALKDWIQMQPHLRARTDDQFLIQFLRGCKYSLEKAKEKIDHFYALKTKCPDLFMTTNIDDARFRRFHNAGSYVILPTPLRESGPRIIFNRFTYGLPEFSIEDVVRNSTANNEILIMSDPYACVYGNMYIFDFTNATTAHLMTLTPTLAKKLIMFYEKTLPLRIKGVCVVNLSPYAHKILNMLLQYVPEKLKQRIFLCGTDLSVIEEHLPKKYFPIEYGGENGSMDEQSADFNKVWDEYRDYFKQNAEFGTDERLRVGKKIDLDGEIGIGGSFRKIDVD